MGSPLFPSVNGGLLQSTFNPFRAMFNRQNDTAAPAAPLIGTATSDVSDVAFPNGKGDVQTLYDAFIYSARVEQVALSLSAASSKQAAGDDSSVETDPAQILFRFYAESRTEELAMFRQRTAETAGKLPEPSRESYLEMSQRIGIRFSVSLEISGAALNGFAKSSDELAVSAKEVFDKFLNFAKQALDNSDEMFNMIFELLNGFFSQDGTAEDLFNKFLNQFGSGNLFGAGETDPAFRLHEAFQKFSFQLEFEFTFEQTTVAAAQEVKQSDPITLDLNGNGVQLTSYRNGARFDITGSGEAVTTAFVTGGDAFLAIDRNGNGKIDNGTELFGDQNGASNGFEELRKLDTNGDGRITAADRDFDRLLLWKDNGNGITEDGELVSLAQEGIVEISLAYRNVNLAADNGNRISQVTSFVRKDGSRGTAADVILNYLA